jgi:hypothetical protein
MLIYAIQYTEPRCSRWFSREMKKFNSSDRTLDDEEDEIERQIGYTVGDGGRGA